MRLQGEIEKQDDKERRKEKLNKNQGHTSLKDKDRIKQRNKRQDMDKTSKILSKKEMKQDEKREEKATTMREREQCEKKMKRRTRQYEKSLRAGCDVRACEESFSQRSNPQRCYWSITAGLVTAHYPQKLNFHLPTSCEEDASKHRSGKIIWVDPK